MYSIKTIFRKKIEIKGPGTPKKWNCGKIVFSKKTFIDWSYIVSKHFSEKNLEIKGPGTPKKWILENFVLFSNFFHWSEVIFKMCCRDEVYGESLYKTSGLWKGCREVSWHVLDFIRRCRPPAKQPTLINYWFWPCDLNSVWRNNWQQRQRDRERQIQRKRVRAKQRQMERKSGTLMDCCMKRVINNDKWIVVPV